MTYSEFKKKLERIDAILAGAGISEGDVEIGINDHDKRAWSISSLSTSVDIDANELKSERAVILIVSE